MLYFTFQLRFSSKKYHNCSVCAHSINSIECADKFVQLNLLMNQFRCKNQGYHSHSNVLLSNLSIAARNYLKLIKL